MIGYDLLNEPWPGRPRGATCLNPAGCPAFDATTLAAFHDRVLDRDPRGRRRRRSSGTSRNVLFNFGADSHHADDRRRRGRLQLPRLLPRRVLRGPARPTCRAAEELVFDNADEQSERDRRRPAPDRVRRHRRPRGRSRRMVELADEHMVSWQYWHYCDCDDPTTAGPGVQAIVIDPSKPPQRRERQARRSSRARAALPAAVAGTPTRATTSTPRHRLAAQARLGPNAPRGAAAPRQLETEVFVPDDPVPRRLRGRRRRRARDVRTRNARPAARTPPQSELGDGSGRPTPVVDYAPAMTDLEERSIEALPDRGENCGAKLTGAEKRTALERGDQPRALHRVRRGAIDRRRVGRGLRSGQLRPRRDGGGVTGAARRGRRRVRGLGWVGDAGGATRRRLPPRARWWHVSWLGWVGGRVARRRDKGLPQLHEGGRVLRGGEEGRLQARAQDRHGPRLAAEYPGLLAEPSHRPRRSRGKGVDVSTAAARRTSRRARGTRDQNSRLDSSASSDSSMSGT